MEQRRRGQQPRQYSFIVPSHPGLDVVTVTATGVDAAWDRAHDALVRQLGHDYFELVRL